MNNSQQPKPTKGGVEVYSIMFNYLGNEGKESGEESGEEKEIKELLKSRYDFGKKKYGQALMTEDGRDVVRDLEEELLDAIYYLSSALYTKKDITRAKKMLKILNDMIKS